MLPGIDYPRDLRYLLGSQWFDMLGTLRSSLRHAGHLAPIGFGRSKGRHLHKLLEYFFFIVIMLGGSLDKFPVVCDGNRSLADRGAWRTHRSRA